MNHSGKRVARQRIYFVAGAMRKTAGLSHKAQAAEKEEA